MKKIFLFILMIFVVSIQAVSAVPAAPNCSQAKAKVLSVEEAPAGNPYRGPTLGLEITNVNPCLGMRSVIKKDAKIKVTTSSDEENISKVRERDVISAKIEFQGDEHGHGYHANEVQILQPAHQ